MSWRPLRIWHDLRRNGPGAAGDRAVLGLRTWVDHSRKAALIALEDGTILHANESARAIFSGALLPASIVEAIVECGLSGMAQFVNYALDDAAGAIAKDIVDGRRLFDIDIVPARLSPNGAPRYVLSAREITLEVNLTNALAESRRRFKDLVECSADFAWESDRSGHFRYVSSRGALGFPAGWLDGAQTRLLLPDEVEENPFLAQMPLSEAEVTLKDKAGQAATVSICALPLFDEDGEWVGARGVCRDVTLMREHEEALREMRERDLILHRLITDIRDCVDPEQMLPEAARLTASAVNAPFCIILRVGFGNRRLYSFDDGAGEGLAALQKFAGQQATRLIDNPGSPIHLMTETGSAGLAMVAALTRHNQTINGIMCLARRKTAGPWLERDRLLIDGVADYIGIAIAQTAAQEKLKLLARTDELTGLLNRRGFQDQVEPRLHALRRSRQQAALLYLDLDNFKEINDRYGHDRGDAVLRTLGIYLDGHIRGGDHCARLGGDEFVVWFDDTTEEGAVRRAAELLGLSADLQRIGGETVEPLSMSIGIVMTNPLAEEETMTDLLDRADRAMYGVKRSGKGAFVVAPPAARKKKTG
jgi:diguanylate cyclase (GGDEF)-like protein/PAS domain S-box-containing protein